MASPPAPYLTHPSCPYQLELLRLRTQHTIHIIPSLLHYAFKAPRAAYQDRVCPHCLDKGTTVLGDEIHIICQIELQAKLLNYFLQIELQAKLLNYFLGSNKSNINQTAQQHRGCYNNSLLNFKGSHDYLTSPPSRPSHQMRRHEWCWATLHRKCCIKV